MKVEENDSNAIEFESLLLHQKLAEIRQNQGKCKHPAHKNAECKICNDLDPNCKHIPAQRCVVCNARKCGDGIKGIVKAKQRGVYLQLTENSMLKVKELAKKSQRNNSEIIELAIQSFQMD